MTTLTIRRIVLGATAALLLVGLSAGAFVHAQDQNTSRPPHPFLGPGGPGGPRGFRGPMGMLPMLGRAINLTDAQKEQLKAIADAHKDEWRSLADRELAARSALNDAVTADVIDEAAIRQKSAEVAAVDADMAVARAHAHAEMLQILTADQKAQLNTMQQQMKQRMQNRPQARLGHLLERLGL
jgi:Spy/CpxP family protein refolding chaperone